MFQLYTATGSIFIIMGLLVASYLFCVVKVQCTHPKNSSAVINTIVTISTGAVYIYFSTLFEESNILPTIHVSVPEDTILNVTNNQITQDLFEINNHETTIATTTEINNDDFLAHYQQFLNSVLKNQEMHRKSRAVAFTSDENAECLRNTFLQHAMMIYAFVQSVLFQINYCKRNKDRITPYYTVGYVILLLLLPVLSTTALYYVVVEDSNTATTWTNKTNELEINITTSNNTEINSVVRNIYRIINSTNTTALPHNVKFSNKQTFENDCNYITNPFKIYIFLLIILGYITTIFYLKTLNTPDNNQNKKCLYLFGVFWLPGVTELFTRIFLTEEMPSTMSNLFATIGSANLLLINIHDAFTIRKHNKNIIKPAGEA